MITSTVYKRGSWLLRFFTVAFLFLIAFTALKVPLPVLSMQDQKEKTPFFQTRHDVRKKLFSRTSLGMFTTILNSPFTLLYFNNEGLVEAMHDVKGRSIEEEKETRFFNTGSATFIYSTLDLEAKEMDFVFEKGIKTAPKLPYFEGKGEDIHIEFIEGAPHITAEKIKGNGEIPFFFGEKKHAARS